MASVAYIGSAQDVSQVDTITFTGTWAASETVTVTCNKKSVTVTGGSTLDTPAEYAAALAEALSLTGTSANATVLDYTVNAGGKDYGEFYDFAATASGAVVTLTGTPGVPFTVTTGETSTSGGITHSAAATAATGKNHFDNADNWEGGSAPSNNDSVILDERSPSILYALDSTTTGLDLIVKDTFTGSVGLPPVNNNTPGRPYTEYRQLDLDLPNTATTGTQTITAGEFGTGISPNWTIRLDLGAASGAYLFVFVKNGRANDATLGASLQLKGGDLDGLSVARGSVSAGTDLAAAQVELTALYMQWGTSQATDAWVVLGGNCVGTGTTTIDQNGGQLYLGADNFDTIDIRAGTFYTTEFSATYGDTMTTVHGGARFVRLAGITQKITVKQGGIFDNSQAQYDLTTSILQLHAGSSYIDPYGATTHSNGIDFVNCSPHEVTWQVEPNKTWTPSAI